MRVTVEVREEAFRTPKTPQQIEEDVRQGATMLWLARGDVTPDGAREITPRTPAVAPPVTMAAPAHEPMLYDLLILGPDVGEDSDFERSRHPGRELPTWDT
jgi:hypothetical protein